MISIIIENESDDDSSVKLPSRDFDQNTEHSNIRPDNSHKAKDRLQRKLSVNTKRINQELRMKSKKYLGYRIPANQMNAFHDTHREQRKIGPTSTSIFCVKSKKRQCSELSEELQKDIYIYF